MTPITAVEDLRGRYVLLRTSLNVPVTEGVVTNAFRIRQALPTMRYLQAAGAKTIVIAHIGRDPQETLQPVCAALQQYLPVQWGGVAGSDECQRRRELMADGDLLLLENTRQDARYKDTSSDYDEALATLGDVFVFDAFAVAHRAQASVTGPMAHLPTYAGLTFLTELRQLQAAMQPASPSLFMLGGAKFATKLPLIEQYLDTYDQVFVGGALINDVLKAKGYEVGQSLLSDIDLAGKAFLDNEKLLLPIDMVVTGPDGDRVALIADVQPDESMRDIGPQTIALLGEQIAAAKMILWNGPFGYYEGGYQQGTETIAQLVAAAPAQSVLGGGDTVAAIESLGLNDEFTHVSTGGGAMLEFLKEGTLPVLDAATNIS